jgi:hypothetical protein
MINDTRLKIAKKYTSNISHVFRDQDQLQQSRYIAMFNETGAKIAGTTLVKGYTQQEVLRQIREKLSRS